MGGAGRGVGRVLACQSLASQAPPPPLLTRTSKSPSSAGTSVPPPVRKIAPPARSASLPSPGGAPPVPKQATPAPKPTRTVSAQIQRRAASSSSAAAATKKKSVPPKPKLAGGGGGKKTRKKKKLKKKKAEGITLRLVKQDESEQVLKMRKDHKFERLINHFATQQKMEPNLIKLFFDGQRIDPKKTPMFYAIEDHDQVDMKYLGPMTSLGKNSTPPAEAKKKAPQKEDDQEESKEKSNPKEKNDRQDHKELEREDGERKDEAQEVQEGVHRTSGARNEERRRIHTAEEKQQSEAKEEEEEEAKEGRQDSGRTWKGVLAGDGFEYRCTAREITSSTMRLAKLPNQIYMREWVRWRVGWVFIRNALHRCITGGEPNAIAVFEAENTNETLAKAKIMTKLDNGTKAGIYNLVVNNTIPLQVVVYACRTPRKNYEFLKCESMLNRALGVNKLYIFFLVNPPPLHQAVYRLQVGDLLRRNNSSNNDSSSSSRAASPPAMAQSVQTSSSSSRPKNVTEGRTRQQHEAKGSLSTTSQLSDAGGLGGAPEPMAVEGEEAEEKKKACETRNEDRNQSNKRRRQEVNKEAEKRDKSDGGSVVARVRAAPAASNEAKGGEERRQPKQKRARTPPAVPSSSLSSNTSASEPPPRQMVRKPAKRRSPSRANVDARENRKNIAKPKKRSVGGASPANRKGKVSSATSEDERRKARVDLSSSSSSPSSSTTTTTTGKKSDMDRDQKIAKLVDMGFPPQEASSVLDRFRGQVEKAVATLLSRRPATKTQTQPRSPSTSSLQKDACPYCGNHQGKSCFACRPAGGEPTSRLEGAPPQGNRQQGNKTCSNNNRPPVHTMPPSKEAAHAQSKKSLKPPIESSEALPSSSSTQSSNENELPTTQPRSSTMSSSPQQLETETKQNDENTSGRSKETKTAFVRVPQKLYKKQSGGTTLKIKSETASNSNEGRTTSESISMEKALPKSQPTSLPLQTSVDQKSKEPENKEHKNKISPPLAKSDMSQQNIEMPKHDQRGYALPLQDHNDNTPLNIGQGGSTEDLEKNVEKTFEKTVHRPTAPDKKPVVLVKYQNVAKVPREIGYKKDIFQMGARAQAKMHSGWEWCTIECVSLDYLKNAKNDLFSVLMEDTGLECLVKRSALRIHPQKSLDVGALD